MDKILERLGIYDLVGVMFSGLIILLLTKYMLAFLNLKIEIDDTFQMLIISYFIGLVFQEIGSKLNCWKILISIFKPTRDLHISLLQKEIDFLIEEGQIKLGYENATNNLVEIYIFCKTKSNGDLDFDRKQALSGMARSLMIYFLFSSSVLIIGFFITFDYKYLVILFLCLCLSWIFYNRYKRFLRMKYVHVLRSYYCSNILN